MIFPPKRQGVPAWRKGFIEYKLQLPKDLKPESIKGAKLYAIGGKANEERLDWPARKNPQDYPQSDSKLWPTTITVSIDGKELGAINYPMDTADARGVFPTSRDTTALTAAPTNLRCARKPCLSSSKR